MRPWGPLITTALLVLALVTGSVVAWIALVGFLFASALVLAAYVARR